MFIENFFLIYHLKVILLSLVEISEIFNRENFRNEISQQDWSFDESEIHRRLKIQIWYGLTRKQNFCALSTPMLQFELDVLN